MPDEYTTVRQPVPRLSDDEQDARWGLLSADLRELEQCMLGYEERIVSLEQRLDTADEDQFSLHERLSRLEQIVASSLFNERLDHLEQVCAQCIAEHQGRGQ